MKEVTKTVLNLVSDVGDKPLWVLDNSGVYSVKSLYMVINFGGVQDVYRDCIWKITVPPNIHVFFVVNSS